MDLDAALDELYAQPLSDFIATRNALAKQLEGEDARELRSRRKPNLVVWTLNQVSRRHRADVDALLEIGERLRGAQRRTASGGSGDELREVQAERRRVVGRLAKAAAAILTDAGHAATPATLKKIEESLTASAADEEGASLLALGRLHRELVPGGFVDVGGLEVLPGEGKRLAKRRPDLKAVEPKVDEREVRAAREALDEAKASAARAEERAKDAEAEAERLSREARELELAAIAARREAKLARQRAKSAREEAEAAAKAEAEARSTLGDLER